MKRGTLVKTAGFLLCATVFLMIALNLQNGHLLALDLSVTKVLAAQRTPFTTALMRGMTTLCAPITLLVICLALMYIFRKKHYSIPIAINLMVSVSLNYTLKNVFLRERPPLLYRAVAETGYSFPSGHAMAAMAFYGFLIYIVAQSTLGKAVKRLMIGLLSLVIALVGLSRIDLGVHYLSDVIAGFAVATAYLIVFSSVVGQYLRSDRPVPLSPMGIQKGGRLADSFGYAFDGLIAGFKNERNMIVHFSAMSLVTVFGFLLNISESEWLACIILFGLVIAMELINTAIETTVDICMPHTDPRAKVAKDTAAGAVMLASIAAAVVGMIVFLPKLWPLLR